MAFANFIRFLCLILNSLQALGNIQCAQRQLIMSRVYDSRSLTSNLSENVIVRSLADCQLLCQNYKSECGCTSIAYITSTRQCYIFTSGNIQEASTFSDDVFLFERRYYRDCDDIKKRLGSRRDGIYEITPDLSPCNVITTFCDMNINGNKAWTVFQRRRDGSVDFNKDWQSYAIGFGDPCGEFWMGNEALHQITSSANYVMKVDLIDDSDGKQYKAIYGIFKVGSESQDYDMNYNGFNSNSNTENNGLSFHKGIAFSTFDKDNDNAPGNCASVYGNGWWFNACYSSNLNAYGANAAGVNSFIWDIGGEGLILRATQMQIGILVS